ncbi:MAG: GIY-YIG nuclease family protein, partial [Thermoguttaceae bacterium]|nr:GIY-YIG nuclease family protein [Thermoguttaceae bacterium]
IKRQIREEEKTRRRLKEAEERAKREKEAVEKKLAEERKQIALIEKRIQEARADERARMQFELEQNRVRCQITEELYRQSRDELERRQRATSQAELTKAGHVYILSNKGSFGPGVYKIGMTRRLDPRVRVAELSSASVPFPFDVHMLLPSENAPALEHELHQALSRYRVNKAKPKKEFFKVPLETLVQEVKRICGDAVEFIGEAEMEEYRETLRLTESEEDARFVADVCETVRRELYRDYVQQEFDFELYEDD